MIMALGSLPLGTFALCATGDLTNKSNYIYLKSIHVILYLSVFSDSSMYRHKKEVHRHEKRKRSAAEMQQKRIYYTHLKTQRDAESQDTKENFLRSEEGRCLYFDDDKRSR